MSVRVDPTSLGLRSVSADEHLNEVQFSHPRDLVEKWDPALKDPETFRAWTGPKYVENLAADIKERGIQNPIQVVRRGGGNRWSQDYIYDGHHRLLAALDLGHERVPWKYVSGKPGEQ